MEFEPYFRMKCVAADFAQAVWEDSSTKTGNDRNCDPLQSYFRMTPSAASVEQEFHLFARY